jgi:hypothetical protein
MSVVQLKYFTRPEILQQIGHIRLPMFLAGFAKDLKAANLVLSEPPDPNDPRIPDPAPDSPHAIYFASVADFLSNPAMLPERLRTTLFTLEAAASPENHDRLQEAIQRGIPCISLNGYCPLDCALELWFAVPDELAQFQNQGKDECETDVRFHPATPQPGEGGSVTNQNPEPPVQPACPAEDPGLRRREPDEGQPAVTGTAFEIQKSQIQPGDLRHANGARPSTANFQPSANLDPWPEPVDGKLLLDTLTQVLNRFVVLLKWAPEALALWIVHTFAFQLREVSTYIGIESPEKQCGKTTLLTVLAELVNRPVAAANISPPAFFRVI